MIKAAIFDFDGTLFDTMPFWSRVGSRMIQKAGLEPVEGLDDTVLFMTLEESCAFIKKTYDLKESVGSLIDNVVKEVTDFYINEASPKPGIPEFLSELSSKGVKMAIATASDRRLITAALRRFGLDRYFAEIFTCTELGLNKQSGVIYNRAAEFLGTGINESAVFEDILIAARSAKEAGFFTVGIEDIESRRDRDEIIKTVDLYIASPEDFNKFWSYTE